MLSRGRDQVLASRTGNLPLPGPRAPLARQPPNWGVPVRDSTRTHRQPIDKPSPAPITIKLQFFFLRFSLPRSAALHHHQNPQKLKKSGGQPFSARNPNTLLVASRRSVVRHPFFTPRRVDIWPPQPLDYGTASRWPRMRSSKASLVCFLRLPLSARCSPRLATAN